jgi:hypothetical protein
MAVQNFGTGGGGFQLSPGVSVSEIDLTTIVPSVDTTSAAIAGVFRWGPVEERVLITSENDLVNKFGKPNNENAETWFSAANFLAYSRTLYVSRAYNTLDYSAIATSNPSLSPSSTYTVKNASDYEARTTALTGVSAPEYYARSIGTLGNSLKVSVCDSANQYSSALVLNDVVTYSDNVSTVSAVAVANADGFAVASVGTGYSNGDFLVLGSTGWSTPAKLTVTTNTLGNVVSLSVNTAGNFFGESLPVNPVTPSSVTSNTGGASTGTGALVNLTLSTSLLTGSFDGELTMPVSSTEATITLANSTVLPGNNPLSIPTLASVSNNFILGDYLKLGDTGSTSQYLKITAITPVAATTGGRAAFTLKFDQPLKIAVDDGVYNTTTSVQRFWEYFSQVNDAPGRSSYVEANGNTALQFADPKTQKDEIHVVVVDEDGEFTGSPGAVLETYQALSRATDSKLSDGTTNYYKNVINSRSNYIWVGKDRTSADSATALNVATSTPTLPLSLSLRGGSTSDETNMSLQAISKAYDLFVSPEESDISLVITGRNRGISDTQLANYVIDNIAEVRKDCVVFVSPSKDDVVNQTVNAADNIISFRNSLRSSSYAVLDSGYKYQYDKYNDLYRWIPLNGDIAGLCARTDAERDPWYSPAGTARGAIRNVVKLAFNPNKSERDQLYKNGINPVITQQGQGTNLFGDKTLLAKPSAFDRINVRRLFITLEKAISNASKSLLFEFNDEFTRAQFVNLVEPFLRDVQGRRGIYDYKVVCDETNNTPQVIDSNRFVGDIYIKPARSINFIQLNFVAVRSGIEFSEIVG